MEVHNVSCYSLMNLTTLLLRVVVRVYLSCSKDALLRYKELLRNMEAIRRVFCMLNSVLTLVRAFSFAFDGLGSTIKVHDSLLNKFVHSPMLFFFVEHRVEGLPIGISMLLNHQHNFISMQKFVLNCSHDLLYEFLSCVGCCVSSADKESLRNIIDLYFCNGKKYTTISLRAMMGKYNFTVLVSFCVESTTTGVLVGAGSVQFLLSAGHDFVLMMLWG